MTKYDQSFKQQMVKKYLDGEGSCESLGQKYGVGYSTLRRWVSAFRAPVCAASCCHGTMFA
ncbi:helix-turn-helix domain-containing protein [Burkholderia ubonensis]